MCIVVAPGPPFEDDVVSYGTSHESCKTRAEHYDLLQLDFLDFLIYIRSIFTNSEKRKASTDVYFIL